MNLLKGKRILIFQQRLWGKMFGRFLAKKLYDEGCRLAALTFKRTTHQLITAQKDVSYDLIVDQDSIESRPKDYLQGEEYSLGEICRALGLESIWPLVASLRNYVRSYQDKYYFCFRQNVSDQGIIDYVQAVYKYVNFIFSRFSPDFIIAPNFVHLPHLVMNLFATKRGVPMLAISDSKIKGYCIFNYGYNKDRGPFHERVDELNLGKTETINRNKARQYIKEFRENFKIPDSVSHCFLQKTIIQKIKQELLPYLDIWRWYSRDPMARLNVLESTGITIDYRPPRIILRDHYCHKYYTKFAQRFDYECFDEIKKFVYFPLQFQPEEEIDVIAPFFTNQIETARQVAMALPDDYTLIVKEHPMMVGKRPASYLEKVARTPNVKLIDYRLPSEKILKRAALVITPTGTISAEAAFLKVPVIQLGNLGTTLRLPNVFWHADITTLSKKIKEVLAANLNSAEYERRLENYAAAVYDTGFRADYIKGGLIKPEGREVMWQVFKKELERVFARKNKSAADTP